MISFLIGIITAAIVFYMSMIYGNAALALLGCFMCVFMVLTFIALLVKAHRAVAAINIPIAIATQGESIRVSLSCRLKEGYDRPCACRRQTGDRACTGNIAHSADGFVFQRCLR